MKRVEKLAEEYVTYRFKMKRDGEFNRYKESFLAGYTAACAELRSDEAQKLNAYGDACIDEVQAFLERE